ncbi:MAG: class I SAM-dependent methyltransferase [Alphaproteobacteria bacterium]|nr:class I SAM-dependent methyltransferase [Alphaproteobacteria bacterium]
MIVAEQKPKNSKDDKKSKKQGKAGRKASKELVRRTLLSRLPKGGIAIEIGVWHGDFSSTILELIEPKKLFLIDPWAHIVDDSHSEAFVGRTESDKMDRIFKKVQKRYSSEIEAGKVSLIRDFSVPALKTFRDGSLSFAYVDGDHSYEGVSADLNALFPKMKAGGVMAFDDYHRRGWWGDGVIRAIHEFLGQHPTQTRVRALAGAQIAIEKLSPLPAKKKR